MDGIHDLGGMQGFGPIPRGSRAEQTFEADWERRVFGLALLGGPGNVDAFRHAIERVAPADYLRVGYWGRWLAAAERLAAEGADGVPENTAAGARREIARAARFATGDAVRVRDLHTRGHTRLPGYARGRRGTVVAQRGGWVFPDSNAREAGEDPQHVYTVRFDGRELWGDTAESGTHVHLDCFEPYLEADVEAHVEAHLDAERDAATGGSR